MNLTDVTIGQYHIIEQIGKGGMATVYKAYQSNLDRYVAFKVMDLELAVAKDFRTRFEREARAIARLRHRNILTVFDYGRQDDIFYLVTEYVSGGSFKEHLGWPQDLSYSASIISQVGDALTHAHRQGTIHRDVKPGNILMVDDDWPLLSDFGLAKMLADNKPVTVSGASVGTPQYMSPEQAQGLPVDQRSDIYSLGVVLYEAVTGQLPFGTDSPLVIILKQVNEPVTPPHLLRSDLSIEMEQVILKALAKSPADRYQYMEEFLADLHSAFLLPPQVIHRANAPLAATESSAVFEAPPTPVVDFTPVPRRRSTPWIRGVMGLMLIVASTLVALLVWSPEPLLGSLSLELRPTLSISPTPAVTATSAAIAASPTATATTPVPPTLPATSRPRATWTPSATISPAADYAPAVTPTPTPFQIELRQSEIDGADMVFVPAGEFVRGSEELGDDERPVRRIYLDDFWIDRYEVTNEQFARFVAETGYQTETERQGWGWIWTGSESEQLQGANWRHPDGPESNIEAKLDHPVVLVSWYDAEAYCRWAGKKLPGEAQWEKAARGPSPDQSREWHYAWGNTFDKARTNTQEARTNDTTPAGNFSPQGDSFYGAADLTGNVLEWMADWYDSDYYQTASPTNPAGPSNGTDKVLRGGSWSTGEFYARTSFRHNLRPDYSYDFTGFRCSSR